MIETLHERPMPFVFPEMCKGCGRCIDACPKHCISLSTEVNPQTGLIPIVLDLEACNGCGLCITACPEPYGLQAERADAELRDPAKLFGPRPTSAPEPAEIPDRQVALPAVEPLVLKGNYAAAVGALIAGCRHFYGYPITPSTEGAELMAKILPQLDGVFLQAVSEVATVNLMYGCGGAGLRAMTFTSSPGFSLMLEGISYMIGAELPGVFIDVMRGGPGLGNIAPEQSDIKLACRGLGHGNTHAIVLAPATPQEMLDLTRLAFDLSFAYRNPVVILGDGYLGQMTGKVRLPTHMVDPGLPAWAVWGDESHRRNLICSIFLAEPDLEAHNRHLLDKYARIAAREQRADLFHLDDAETVVVACNTPAQIAKGAVAALRQEGGRVGLFRPITLWPFPIDLLQPHLGHIPSAIAPRDVALKLAGAGGDGAQTAAMLITRAAINEGFDSTHIPSYGPESRGGTSYADVHVAIDEVLSPASPRPHVLVAFNAPSLEKFAPAVAPGGTVIYDSSVIREVPAGLRVAAGVQLYGAPFTQIAADLGKVVVKNVVALGALQAATGIFPRETFLTAIRQALKDKCAMIPLNEEAFDWGVRAVTTHEAVC